MKTSNTKMTLDDFCRSSSQHFDNIVASFTLPEETMFPDLDNDADTFNHQPQSQPPLPIALPEEPDLRQLHKDVSFVELKNAAIGMANNKHSAFDLTWEFYLGQLSTAINSLQAQNIDTSYIYVLNNMAEHLRAEMKTIRHCVYYSILQVFHQREKEDAEKKKRLRASLSKAKNRAKKRTADCLVSEALKQLEPVPQQQLENSPAPPIPPTVLRQIEQQNEVQEEKESDREHPRLVVKIKRPKKSKKEKRSKENIE